MWFNLDVIRESYIQNLQETIFLLIEIIYYYDRD